MNETRPKSRVALFDFILTLVRTDFKVRYHGQLGGFFWALLKPVAMFIVLYRVFHLLFVNRSYLLNLLTGILLWSFFAEGTPSALESLLGKRHLLTKATVPRWIVIVASLSNALITMIVFSVAICVMVLLEGKSPGIAGFVLFYFYLLLYVVIVAGFGLGASVLFLHYRDLNQVWDVVLQAGFYLTPIIYPLDVIPERYHFYLYLWPVTPIVQFSRQALLGGPLPTLKAHLMLIGMVAVVFGAGVLIYSTGVKRALEKL
jgi:lipopolysaccharide transport system permease protein